MSGLLGKKPKPAEPVRMPDPEDDSAREAARRQMSLYSSRGGRASTDLSGNYSGSRLGSSG